MASSSPVTPPSRSSHPASSPGGKIASPSGSMSTSSRRKPPSFPASPRRIHAAHKSHHPALDSPTTPAVLRVPPTPLYSPAFQRSGYAQQPHYSSAPPLSAKRLEPLPTAKTPTTSKTKLEGIPQGFVIKSLNNLAKYFWEKPESSDCTIIIPISRISPPASAKTPGTADSTHSNQPQHSFWPPTPTIAPLAGAQNGGRNVVSSHRDSLGRRGSAPGPTEVRVLTFPLHRDYLITQSTLFRSLLSSTASHLDLPVSQSIPPSPTVKGSRVLPSPEGSPTSIFLPIPDPASFGVLVHWLYWGEAAALESALSRGLVTWQGVVKNVDYLGLDDGIKRVIGKWWRRWVKVAVGRQGETNLVAGGGEVSKGMGVAYDTATSSDEEESVGGEEADEEDGMDIEGERTSGNAGDGDREVAGLMGML
ncbi:hypothetical protein P7C73_g42, partial [Tremellales sp. Uapishka_1]